VNVTNVNITNINVYPRNYAYARHAVVVPQRDFYRVNNYRNVRVKNVNNTTIINNYQASPIVNNKVISDYSTTKQKYNFTNVQVKEKPHRTVNDRIETNQKEIQRGRIEKASIIEQQAKNVQEGKFNREAKIQQPKVTNLIVPAHEVNKPKSEMKLQQRELRRVARETKDDSGELVKPAPKAGRVSPKVEGVDSGKTMKPVARPEGIASPPKQDGQIQNQEKVTIEKLDQPIAKPERVKPPRPRPVEKPDGSTPIKSAPKSDDISPAKPPKPERIPPPKSMKQKQEMTVPDKSGQKIEGDIQEKPALKHEREAHPKAQPKQKPDKSPPDKKGDKDQPHKKPLNEVPPKVQQNENKQ
jgi:hypothetical protein